MQFTLSVLLLFAGTASVCFAEDLDTIFRDALANDVQFAAANAQYVATKERVPQSVAAMLPSVSLSTNTVWNEINSNVAGRQDYNSHMYSVTLTQPVFRLQNNLGVDQSRALVDQAKAQMELARHDLIVRVTQGYFDVLLAQETLNVLKAQRTAIAEQYSSAKRTFEIGTATITDVRDAKARYDLVTAQEIAAANDLAAKRQALRVLTGKEPGALSPLRRDVALSSPNPNEMDAWVKATETGNMAVVAGQAAVEAARLEARKARAAHLPTVDLTASQGRSLSATTFTIGTDLKSATFGIQMSVPLYSGGGTLAREREVAALLVKAETELEGARRNGALTARQAFLAVTSGLAQVQALEEALVSTTTALQANKRGLEVGTRLNIDVLNAQQQLSATERDLAKSRYDTLVASVRLKGAAGSLGETDLREINGLLSAEAAK
jgi:outer membrane protein